MTQVFGDMSQKGAKFISTRNQHGKTSHDNGTRLPYEPESKYFTSVSTVSIELPLDIYRETDYEALGHGSLAASFDGILRTIWIASGRMYNQRETLFFYKTLCNRPDSDPAFVHDYESENRYGTGPSVARQHFGVLFQRTEVRPIAYALRSDFAHQGPGTNHLKTFSFQARSDRMLEWDTLDERVQIHDMLRGDQHFLSFVAADRYYTEFRVLQTGPSNNNFLSFNLSGFEIHGHVKLRNL